MDKPLPTVYISRTNRVEESAFEELLEGLSNEGPEVCYEYYEQGKANSVTVRQADLLIIMPTIDGQPHESGILGKGVHKQVQEARDKDIPVILWDQRQLIFVNINHECFAYDYDEDATSWNNMVELDWTGCHKFRMNDLMETIKSIMKEKTVKGIRHPSEEREFEWDLADSLPPKVPSRYFEVKKLADFGIIGPLGTLVRALSSDKRILFRLR